MTEPQRYTIIDLPEFNITGEWVVDPPMWVLHSDVHSPWTKSLRKRYTEIIARIATVANAPCFAFQAPSHDPKKRKFIQQVGGVLDHLAYTDDGELAEMFRFPPLEQSKGRP